MTVPSAARADVAGGVTRDDLAVWDREFRDVCARLDGLFYRTDSRAHARHYVRGLMASLERKNGWTIAEYSGDPEPKALQRLLNLSPWDADEARDLVRVYAMEHFADPRGVLIADPTGFVKKGNKSAGVQRQYSGTLGRIDNCQIGVFLAYVNTTGDRVLIDRELYMPEESWCADPGRRAEAHVPEEVTFATNAREMRRFEPWSGVPTVVTLSDDCLVWWLVGVGVFGVACRGWGRLQGEDPVSEADLRCWSLPVSFYPVSSLVAVPGGQIAGGDLATVMVAVPVSALAWPVRAGADADGRSGLVITGADPVKTGDPVAWCKVVVVTPAVVRRDGRVQAQGRPCDHARLGAVEGELDRRCGPGTIERIAADVRLSGGKIKATVRREMSVAFTIRAVLLMTLMPEADYREVLATLLGDLIMVPWRRAHAVPSGTVLSTWRGAIGAGPMTRLQRELLGAVVAEHRPEGTAGPPGVEVGGGLRLGAIDGTVTRMPDTKANREAFGTAGAVHSGYPQIRHLHATDAVTRSTLAAVLGPAGGDKAEAEQVLLDRMLAEHPGVFGPDRVWVMDRNFPGVGRIAAMLAIGTHVLIRVKSDIRLDRLGGFAPDGSYLARVSGGGTTLTLRVIEYHVSLDDTLTPELFCLVTDLLDHVDHPPARAARRGVL
jgi:hypothetical protein